MSLSYPLISALLGQSTFSRDTLACMHSLKHSIHQEKRKQSETDDHALIPSLSEDMQYTVRLTQEKGASAWLSALPLKEFNFIT